MRKKLLRIHNLQFLIFSSIFRLTYFIKTHLKFNEIKVHG